MRSNKAPRSPSRTGRALDSVNEDVGRDRHVGRGAGLAEFLYQARLADDGLAADRRDVTRTASFQKLRRDLSSTARPTSGARPPYLMGLEPAHGCAVSNHTPCPYRLPKPLDCEIAQTLTGEQASAEPARTVGDQNGVRHRQFLQSGGQGRRLAYGGPLACGWTWRIANGRPSGRPSAIPSRGCDAVLRGSCGRPSWSPFPSTVSSPTRS